MLTDFAEGSVARRRLILRDSLAILSLTLATVVLFLVTLFLFRSFSAHREVLAQRWSDRGRASLQAGNPGEAIEEKVSLSDRFGLWLGFHGCDQATYFAMIEAYASHFGLQVEAEKLHAEAVEWSMIRGARSGRVAWQFIQDLAGRLGKPIAVV